MCCVALSKKFDPSGLLSRPLWTPLFLCFPLGYGPSRHDLWSSFSYILPDQLIYSQVVLTSESVSQVLEEKEEKL